MTEITQSTDLNTPRSPGIISGAFVGGAIMAPIIAIMLLADQLLSLPFVPFDLFDWLARTLPGDIIRFGINTIVDFINTFELGETSSVAKTLEHIQGIVTVFGVGVIGGMVVFGLASMLGKRAYAIGTGIGLAIGIAFALITLNVNFTSTASDTTQFLWVITLFVMWGAGVAWIYSDLSSIGASARSEHDLSTAKVNRRQFLVSVGGTTATLTVMGATVGALLNIESSTSSTSAASGGSVADLPDGLPNQEAGINPAPGTRPEYTPLDDHYRIDISARPPILNGETWRLQVNGLVAEPLEISLDDLQNNYEPVDRFVTLSCISNRLAGDLISTTRWTGVPLHILLDEWNLADNASHLRIISADGFDEWVDIDLIYSDTRIMLCYAWDGKPLKQKHGFPLRIWIPDRFGMKQPKWITEIQVVDSWDEGYWVERNWDAEALVQPTSVIDTVATEAAFEQGEQLMIPIGGIAYTGAKGVSKVEISIDDGDWQEAKLREPLSETTWVIWRYDWPFEAGRHSFQVRCYLGDGTLQPTERSSHFPDGATGVHEVATRIPDSVTAAPESTPEAAASS